jgi:C-terminal processing protease CtpA/Prc
MSGASSRTPAMASGAEIVAPAIQHHKRATLVGSLSLGRGLVQKIVPLGTRSGALRLTTGHYFTPNGRSFDGRGLVPDIEVLQDLPANPEDDKVLTAAYDLLRGKIALRTRGRAPDDPVYSAGTLRPFAASPKPFSAQ